MSSTRYSTSSSKSDQQSSLNSTKKERNSLSNSSKDERIYGKRFSSLSPRSDRQSVTSNNSSIPARSRSNSPDPIKNCKCPKLTPEEKIAALESALSCAYGGLRSKDLLIKLQKTKLDKMQEVLQANEARNENLTYINQRLVDDLSHLKNLIQKYEGKYGKLPHKAHEFYKPDIPTSLDTVKGLLLNQNEKLENISKALVNAKDVNANAGPVLEDDKKIKDDLNNSIDSGDPHLLKLTNEALILEIEDLRLQLRTLRAAAITSRELIDDITTKSEAYVNAINDEHVDRSKPKIRISIKPQIHDFEVDDDSELIGSFERFIEDSLDKISTIKDQFQDIIHNDSSGELKPIGPEQIKKDSLTMFKEENEERSSIGLVDKIQNIEKAPSKLNPYKLTIDNDKPRSSINRDRKKLEEVEEVKAKLLLEIQNMKEMSDKLAASIDEERKDWAKKMEEFEKIKDKNNEYRKELESSNLVNIDLRKEKEELLTRIDHIKSQYQTQDSETKDELEEANDIIDSLKRQLEGMRVSKEQEVESLNTSLAERGRKLEELEAELSKCREEIDEKEAQIADLLTLPEKVEEAERTAAAHEERCEELQEKLDQLKSALESTEAEREMLQTKLEETVCDSDRDKSEYNKLVMENENLTGTIEHLEEKIKNLNSLNESITMDYDNCVMELEQLKEAAVDDMNKLREEIDVLTESQKEAYDKFMEANAMLEATLVEKQNIATQNSSSEVSKDDLIHILRECEDYKNILDKISVKIDKHVKEHALYKYEAEQRIKKLLLENNLLLDKYNKEACPLLVPKCCGKDITMQINELRQFIVSAGRHIQDVGIARDKAEEILDKLKYSKNSVCQFICNYDTVNATTSLGDKPTTVTIDIQKSRTQYVGGTNQDLNKRVQQIRERKNAAIAKKVNREVDVIKKEIKRDISNNMNMTVITECACGENQSADA